MFVRFVSSCVCAVVMAGCSGGGRDRGGGPDNPPVSAVLEGRAAGIAYSTPTHSGVTDAAGAFRCMPGETVTFSIGATSLGSASCAASISLFTLAQVTAPGSERALRRELDRARRLATPFTKAINLQHLLLVLDVDSNSANGIDVRDRGAQLATVSLDAAASLKDFEASLSWRVPSGARNLTRDAVVAHLFQSAIVRVAIHAEIRRDTGGLGASPPSANFYDFGANGALVYEGFDLNGDGVADSHFRYTYDALGRLLTNRREVDVDRSGDVDFISVTRQTFDSSGQITSVIHEIDSDADGDVDRRELQNTTYAGAQNVTVYETDGNNDGVIEQRLIETTVRDFANLVQTHAWEMDFNVDEVFDLFERATRTWITPQRLRSVITDGIGANGNVESRLAENHEYPGELDERIVIEGFSDANAPSDNRVLELRSYDRAGNVLSNRYEEDFFADGSVDISRSESATYDADARMLTQLREEDFNGDGIFEMRSSFRITFDDAGRWSESVQENSTGGNTTLSSRTTIRAEFGDGGELLNTVRQLDDDADGTPDRRQESLVTYRLVDDGVRLLAQWYFQRPD